MEAGMRAAGMPEREIASATAALRGQIVEMEQAPPPPGIDNFFFVNYGSFVFMGASSADRFVVKPLAPLMTSAIAGIPGTFGFFSQAPIFRIARQGSGLEVEVRGVEEEKVIAAASAVQMKLMEVFRGFVPSDPQNFNVGREEMRVVPDRVRAAAAGLTSADIRQVTQAAVDGMIVGDFREAGRSIDLTVTSSAGRADRGREDLRQVPIATPAGRVVPLESVAGFVNTTAAQTVRRSEEQPAVQFNVELPAGMTIGEATQIVREQVVAPLTQAGVLGVDATLSLSGAASKLQAFLTAFRPGFVLAAVVTYLLLASLFESWILPLTILLSVPFAMVGGFLGLAALHSYNPQYKLDVLTMLGFVILIGTIINNPILIVHQALNNLGYGMSRREAIARSTQTRVRPIFMSVTTTLAGLTPLVLIGGAGSELYRGLGTVLVGGLALSTFFTLLLTPALLSLVLDAQAFIRRVLFGRSDPVEQGKSGSEGASEPADQQALVTASL
jgi:HAE1 family hydrophobic/amphiphilic exporter-1